MSFDYYQFFWGRSEDAVYANVVCVVCVQFIHSSLTQQVNNKIINKSKKLLKFEIGRPNNPPYNYQSYRIWNTDCRREIVEEIIREPFFFVERRWRKNRKIERLKLGLIAQDCCSRLLSLLSVVISW